MEYEDKMLLGNSLEVLQGLPDEICGLGITSPPYFNLRAYDGDPQIFDANPDCQHEWTSAPGFGTKTGKQGSTEYTKNPSLVKGMAKPEPGMFCVKCGAFFGFLGLEPTPELFISHLVDIFREFRRVLRKDGILFVNMGDTYAGSWGSHKEHHYTSGKYKVGQGAPVYGKNEGWCPQSSPQKFGCKPKDLIGIPHMLVMALRNDGWWWRSTIIWKKPNCMPSSATDRPTTDFEYIFMLAKNGAKPSFWTHRDGYGSRTKPKADYAWMDILTGLDQNTEPEGDWRSETFVAPDPDMEAETTTSHKRWKRYNLWRGHAYYYNSDAVKEPCLTNVSNTGAHPQRGTAPSDLREGTYGVMGYGDSGRNKRCVWESQEDDLPPSFLEVPTKGFSGAHFAIFPEKLVEPMLLAGSSDTACPHCGAAWFPRKVKTGEFQRRYGTGNAEGSPYEKQSSMQAIYEDKGLQPTCACENNDGSGASLVCDPFSGAGTTCMVAKKKGRHWLGIDASEKYVEMGEKRVAEAEVDVDPDANQLKMF